MSRWTRSQCNRSTRYQPCYPQLFLSDVLLLRSTWINSRRGWSTWPISLSQTSRTFILWYPFSKRNQTRSNKTEEMDSATTGVHFAPPSSFPPSVCFFRTLRRKTFQEDFLFRLCHDEVAQQLPAMQFSLGSSSKKRINLGGQTSKVEDREKFLQRTENERLRRLQEKKRLQSVLKIQVRIAKYWYHWISNTLLREGGLAGEENRWKSPKFRTRRVEEEDTTINTATSSIKRRASNLLPTIAAVFVFLSFICIWRWEASNYGVRNRATKRVKQGYACWFVRPAISHRLRTSKLFQSCFWRGSKRSPSWLAASGEETCSNQSRSNCANVIPPPQQKPKTHQRRRAQSWKQNCFERPVYITQPSCWCTHRTKEVAP